MREKFSIFLWLVEKMGIVYYGLGDSDALYLTRLLIVAIAFTRWLKTTPGLNVFWYIVYYLSYFISWIASIFTTMLEYVGFIRPCDITRNKTALLRSIQQNDPSCSSFTPKDILGNNDSCGGYSYCCYSFILNQNEINALSRALEGNTYVKELELDIGNDWTEVPNGLIKFITSRRSNLQRLKLSVFTSLATAMENRNWTKQRLQQHKLLEVIFQAVAESHSLQIFRLSGLKIRKNKNDNHHSYHEQGIRLSYQLGRALSNVPRCELNLCAFDYSNGWITSLLEEEDRLDLASNTSLSTPITVSQKKKKKLRALSLRGCDLANDGIQNLCKLLRGKSSKDGQQNSDEVRLQPPDLVELEFTGYFSLPSDDFPLFLHALETNTTLKHLNLLEHRFCSIGMQALMRSLPRMKGLEHLAIRASAGEIIGMLPALGRNQSLKSLAFWDENRICYPTQEHVAAATQAVFLILHNHCLRHESRHYQHHQESELRSSKKLNNNDTTVKPEDDSDDVWDGLERTIKIAGRVEMECEGMLSQRATKNSLVALTAVYQTLRVHPGLVVSSMKEYHWKVTNSYIAIK